jgi:hypothetical protein
MKAPCIIQSSEHTAILIRATKSHAFIIPILNGTLRRRRISLHELTKYVMLDVPFIETVKKHRKHKSGISMEVYDELNNLLKGLDAEPNSN